MPGKNTVVHIFNSLQLSQAKTGRLPVQIYGYSLLNLMTVTLQLIEA